MKRWLLIALLITLLMSIGLYCLPKEHDNRVLSFPHWRDNYDLTQGIIESEGHNAFVEIFLNNKAKASYMSQASTFPVGSEVFKPLYGDSEGHHFARLVIMVKREVGYDSTNGDWWYGVYDEKGTKMWYEGRIPECIACHVIAKETDYLFSRSVMKKLEGIDTNEYEEYEPDGEEY